MFNVAALANTWRLLISAFSAHLRGNEANPALVYWGDFWMAQRYMGVKIKTMAEFKDNAPWECRGKKRI